MALRRSSGYQSHMHFEVAALLLQNGLAPQDFEKLCEEFDLLSVTDAVLHDPETAATDLAHMEELLKKPLVWLPGAPPYGDLWRDVRATLGAASVQLCPKCFPRE